MMRVVTRRILFLVCKVKTDRVAFRAKNAKNCSQFSEALYLSFRSAGRKLSGFREAGAYSEIRGGGFSPPRI